MRSIMAVVALVLAVLAGGGAVASAATAPVTAGSTTPDSGMPYQ